jgi:DNA-binding SARP family transcriptional activator
VRETCEVEGSDDGTIGIGVLGPLVVRRGDDSVSVGGLRPQAILVTLAHHLDTTVRVDTLIEAVWGEHPPKSARNAIQVHISRLRSALGPSFELQTSEHGYRLSAAHVECDVAEFEHRVAAALELAERDPGSFVTMAREALSLWRGDPVADDLGIDVVSGRLVELRDARVRLQTMLLDAQLKLGQHEQCCADAEALAADHPFREDIRCLQLLALYRSGRQSEALAAYRRARRLLVEELGVEPGPELRSLHRQILEQDEQLLGHPTTSRGVPPVAEVTLATDNLRPEPNELVERAEITTIIEALRPGRVVTAVGAGGIGKSRCVAAVARQCIADGRFTDGVWLVDLAPLSEGSADVAVATASAMGLGQQPGVSFTDTVASYLAQRCALVVLDNCEHVAVAAANFVDALLAVAPTTVVVAASRVRLGLASESVVTVDRLTDAGARKLLAARIAETGAGPFADEACAELCAALDNYPLALELAAARTRALTPQEIVARLSEQPELLHSSRDAAAVGSQRRHADLGAALDWSLGQLAPEVRDTLYRSTVFVSDFDLDTAEAVLGTPGRGAGDIVSDLGELVEHHLVSRDHGRARFHVLEPIRQHLAGRASSSAHQRYSDHFAAFAIEAARGLRGRDEAVWWDRLRADLAHVRAMALDAIDRGDVELLDRVMREIAVSSPVGGFVEPGDWALRAMRELEIDPAQAPGIALSAAAYYAHHKQSDTCDALLDQLDGAETDPAVAATSYAIRSLNDPASSRWITLLGEAAEACGDESLQVYAAIQDKERPDVDFADRFGNPTLRVFARSFHSAYVLHDKHGAEARQNKIDLYRIALTSNNEHTIAGGQGFMAIQHCFDGDPLSASPLAVEMIERFAKGRSPFWIWHGVEMIAVLLAMARTDPYTSEKLWTGVTASGTVPYSRLTRDPRLPEWVGSQLTDEERRRARAEGSELDMDAAARQARKAAEGLASG